MITAAAISNVFNTGPLANGAVNDEPLHDLPNLFFLHVWKMLKILKNIYSYIIGMLVVSP